MKTEQYISVSREEFKRLSTEYNVIPVFREMLADMHTPVSAFSQLDDGRFAFLLESVEGGENVGRYSFMGGAPSIMMMTKNNTVTIEKDGENISREMLPGEDPLTILQTLMAECKVAITPGLPRFFGGAVGYMSYDTVRFFEKLPNAPTDDLKLPDNYFVFTDVCVIFDHARHRMLLVVNSRIDGDADAAYDAALEKIDDLVKQLRTPPVSMPGLCTEARTTDPQMNSNMTREEYMDMVVKGKEYITAGDIIQVVLSQRMHRAISPQLQESPFNLYRALRYLNPSPYMYYLSYGDLKIIGSSPERLVSEEEGEVITRPIAGTRKRGKNAAEDAWLAADLLADEKECAEHIMLVDLGRNDLGRV